MAKAIAKFWTKNGLTLAGFAIAGPLGAAIGAKLGSAISGAIFGRKNSQKPSDGQRIVKEPVGSRVRHYGQVRVGGQLSFYESRNGILYVLVTVSQGEINSIEGYQLNGKAVTVNGSGLVTDAKFESAISIHNRLGTDAQTVYTQLSGIFTEWTTNHRQRGCASILMICNPVKPEKFSTVYEGNREPEPSVEIKGSKVYDPRLDSTFPGGSGSHRVDDPSTWAYSDNWALCFADYLAHSDGYGLGYDRINWANIAEEADECDATVTTVDMRTIARWRVAGSYRLADDERRSVIAEFIKAADGFTFQDESGLANIRCGRWIAPTVHIPEKHILNVSASLGPRATDRANEVRVIYTEPRFDYAETEAAPLKDLPAITALGRAEVSRFDCYYSPDHNQAQRAGKRFLARLNGDRWHLSITTNLFGLNVLGQRFITLSIDELDIDTLPFEVVSAPEIDLQSMTISIGLMQVAEDDFSFNAAVEEGDPPGDISDTSATITVETPANVSLSSVAINLGGATGVGIQATWDAPTRTGLIAQAQYKATAASDWIEMNVSQDDRIATTPAVSTGTEYGVRVRFVTISGRVGSWSSTATITPQAVPFTPTDFSGSPGGTGEADLTWRNPTGGAFDHVEIWESTTDDIGTASQVGSDYFGSLGQVMNETISGLSAGTHYFWAIAYDASANESAPTASESVTVS